MKRTLALFVLVVMTSITQTHAVGSLYARPPLSQSDGVPLWLKHYDVNVTVNDQMAVTHVTHVFKNTTSQHLEGIFFFPLPPTAVVTELALWINGERVIGKVYDSDTARSIYQNIVRRMIDPALLEYLGDNIFKLSVFPIDPDGLEMSERKIEITYTELLPYDFSDIRYSFLMKTANLSSQPVQRASLAINLKTQAPVTSLGSSTHKPTDGLNVTKKSDYEYQLTYGEENTHSERDFSLIFQLKNNNFALTHLTYAPDTSEAMFFDSTGDNPYYLLWITPPDSITMSSIIQKNIVFVADISSSMAGTRIVQLRNALESMILMLNPKDRFNIIPFSTGIRLFKPDLVPATEENLAAARAFVRELGESGLTNIEDALKQALQSSWIDTAMNAIVFLTDGKPTWPMNSTGKTIIDTVKARNKDNVAIFTFGVGSEVELGFLKQLALSTNALPMSINDDDSISNTLQHFMEKISYPLLKNIALDCGSLQRNDFFPKNTPNLYAGSQLTQLGRFRNSGAFTIKCTGTIGSQSVTFSRDLSFPRAEHNTPFVARMWASTKIDALLDDIAIFGELPELVNGVKFLGIKYSVITPYTSFLVTEPVNIMEDKTRPLALQVRLLNNFPNPFTVQTTIRFSIPAQATPRMMSLKVYDVSGRLVKTLVNEPTAGGNFMINWDCRNNAGHRVASGLYLAVLEFGTIRQMVTMRMVD